MNDVAEIQESPAPSNPAMRLTDRQKDCLRLVAQGYTSKEIGRKLSLSPSTVDNHVLAATQLLGAASRAEAARNLIEVEARQKLPSELADLAEAPDSSLLAAADAAPVLTIFGRKVGLVPPIGGLINRLDTKTRSIKILQVAAVAFGTVLSLSMLIAGVFRVFS